MTTDSATDSKKIVLLCAILSGQITSFDIVSKIAIDLNLGVIEETVIWGNSVCN